MTAGKALCLNMIVKNEMANLERCLGAVAPHIACWVIGDTGSTDGTQDFIRSFFAARNIPGELHSFPFENFEQARNAALDCAGASPLAFDYLLFDDADMELVVEDADFRARLEAPGYRLIQRTASGLTYWNTRLVRRDAGARYHGVTHEYLDVPGGAKELQRVWYKDHASGANRKDKFERDIRLLSAALEKEPGSHRDWFYLAQSYRDAGRTAEAAEAYAKRAAMGGWDEEAWYARLQEARCRRQMGDEGGFLRQALAAFNQRPQRAEPLYDLARFYRERGMNAASVLFAERGLAMKRPEQDILFLEDFVYQAGFQEEFSIAANYSRDPAQKDRGFAACNWLALNREIPERTRSLAWSNLLFYVNPIGTIMPSFTARPVGFAVPDGYHPSNPSVARQGEQIVLVQRAVNYSPIGDGQYSTLNDAPVQTRNFLLRLSDNLDVQSAAEILPPADMPRPSFNLVLGFEDLRPFVWRGELWGNACVREFTPQGWCEQVLARIDDHGSGPCRLTDWRVLHPEGPRQHEKNWMPRVAGERLQFIYNPTRVVDENGQTIIETTPSIAVQRFRGGSQVIEFNSGWLALIHEVNWRESEKRRYYWHRFVWFDETNKLRAVSRPFFFQKKGIEFAAGLAWHPDGRRLLISYGIGDQEAWIATVDAGEVRGVLEDVEHLPSGTPGTERHAAPITVGDGNLMVRAAAPVCVDSGKPRKDRGASARDVSEAINLELIFRRYGTDKGRNGYAGVYECLFGRGRREVKALLEIGIGTMIPGVHSSMVGYAQEGYKPGGSLRAWRDFFPNATIYGMDVQPDTQFDDEEGIVTFLCNSTDPDQVSKVMGKLDYAKFDIIIDDGSHVIEDQFKTLRNFFPLLKGGGIYVVEDVGHNKFAKQTERIREICGDHAFFSAGPGENPFVLVKRPDSVEAGSGWAHQGVAPKDEQRRVIEPDAAKSVALGDCAGRHNKTNPATPGDTLRVETPAPINREATAEEKFLALAPFLRAVDSPKDRREQSRAFDERIAPFVRDGDTAALPQIHCFYEVMSETATHASLIAATQSMRAVGHPVRVWSYAPAKLDFLTAHGVEVRDAADVVPKSLFERIVARSEIRYFSDIFRYAALYEHGGLWMDTDVVMLRPFPFRGDHFFNLQWRGGHKGHFICGNVIYAEPYSRHMRTLYEQALERFFAERGTAFGDIGPKLLSDYITSDEGSSLQERLFSPMFFNAIDWTEVDRFNQPVADLGDYLNDERVTGIHLWNARTHSAARDADQSLIAMLSNPRERMPSFTSLADRFNTDKNRHTGNRHCYARVYDRLLGARRFALRRLMEIGLCRGLAEKNQSETPSVALWQSYFPFCHVIGVDLTDFSRLNNETVHVVRLRPVEARRASRGRGQARARLVRRDHR